MAKRLFLLDGMALAYRAHFAFINRPIRTSKGLNTSALFGFFNTLLDILEHWEPTHVAVVFDTEAPTPRHAAFPAYKAQRQVMPEDLALALPHIRRLIECFNIPVLAYDGYEADDVIGTLVRRAEPADFTSFMVTPDKDFGQLVTERTLLWKPGRQGGDVEVLKPADVCARWGIRRVDQVVDILALVGDASDNIPGVPGIGEKTAAKLIAQYDTLEGVLAHAAEIKGKVGEALRQHAEQARLSRRLATIDTQVPVPVEPDTLELRPRRDDALQALCGEFEFNAIGRRLFGEQFKAGRGFGMAPGVPSKGAPGEAGELDLFASPPGTAATVAANREAAPETGPTTRAALRTLADTPHRYEIIDSDEQLAALVTRLKAGEGFSFTVLAEHAEPPGADILGLAFSMSAGEAWYVPMGAAPGAPASSPSPGAARVLAALAPVFANPRLRKTGHHLKPGLRALKAAGVEVAGPLFDTMIAHAVIEPDQRHHLTYLAEAYLGYSPTPLEKLVGPKGDDQRRLSEVPREQLAEFAGEAADLAWQLAEKLAPLLKVHGQERVFYEVEMPLLPALTAMEHEGVRIDPEALAAFSADLGRRMAEHERAIHALAGREFNLNSNRQLGELLFGQLRLLENPKKTATGQYATDEQTLQALAGEHEIVRRILEYRAAAKLKSTYADALPTAISRVTGRVHTTFHQAATATGRLSSQDPNLQNIPIRSELGQEIRRAFVARHAASTGEGRVPPRPGAPAPQSPPGRPALPKRDEADAWLILSADYSQIELRIIAAISREAAMIEAFRRGEDIHTATAARVFGVPAEAVTSEMRRQAKMVNYGIAYGISAFGLAQRLGIPRATAREIIDHYFASYPGIRRYVDETIAFAREHGYVETLTGRRRYLPDIRSANATVRAAAERNAINMPIQGTAADMIKIAMGRIHAEINKRKLRSRMLLQVHDELLFDLYRPEESELRALVSGQMKTALPLAVPIEVEIGIGANWLEAH